MLRMMENFEIQALHSENLRMEREKWFIAAKNHKEQRELKAEKAENEFLDLATSAILATEIQVQEFQARLDIYDEATVKALMENTRALEAINERIQQNLKSAHVMEDGTRVFKSEDGTWGIDEHGQRFDSETQNMDAIPETRVTAEEAAIDFDERDLLNRERTEILDYQQKLDEARERSNSDEFTKDELDELDNALEAEMPQAVKRQLPDYDPSQETTLKTDFTSVAKQAVLAPANMAVDPVMVPG